MPPTDLHFKYLLAAGLRNNISLREIAFVNPDFDVPRKARSRVVWRRSQAQTFCARCTGLRHELCGRWRCHGFDRTAHQTGNRANLPRVVVAPHLSNRTPPETETVTRSASGGGKLRRTATHSIDPPDSVPFLRVACLTLMPNCQDQYDILSREPTILCDITIAAPRQDKLAAACSASRPSNG